MTGSWRVPENTLHLLALLGGWPGALYAQQTLRHKTQKTSFRIVFWMTVLANSGGLFYLHSGDGQLALRTVTRGLDDAIIQYIDSGPVRSVGVFLIAFRHQK